jgi:hypothetical protein
MTNGKNKVTQFSPPTSLLSAADAQRVLQKNVANIVKKSASGKTLTRRELALISEFSNSGPGGPVEWVNSYEELAKVFGCHHHSFPRWKKDHADAPTPRHNGGHSVAAWRGFFAAHPEIDLQTDGAAVRTELQLEILRQQCRGITFDNDKAAGDYVAKADIAPALRNLSLQQRALLKRKLEQELPTKLVGLTAGEILVHTQTTVDEICTIFRDGTKDFVAALPTTETLITCPKCGHEFSPGDSYQS